MIWLTYWHIRLPPPRTPLYICLITNDTVCSPSGFIHSKTVDLPFSRNQPQHHTYLIDMPGLATRAAVSLGKGYIQDLSKNYGEKHFQPTKDPYYAETPGGETKRKRLPEGCTKQESKAWKSVQNKAYLHDKSLCGCCCWYDNIGWAPLLALIPGIGPLLMFWVHSNLIKLAKKKFQLPEDLMAKMYGNIAVDLALSLVPLLGSIFTWLHACSTRNAAMTYNYVSKRIVDRNIRLEQEKRIQEQMSGQYSNYYAASQTQFGDTWQQPPPASMNHPYRQARHV